MSSTEKVCGNHLAVDFYGKKRRYSNRPNWNFEISWYQNKKMSEKSLEMKNSYQILE